MSQPMAAQNDSPGGPTVRAGAGVASAAWGPDRRAAAIVLIVLAGLAAYANSLDGAFLFDDRDFSDNPRALSWVSAGRALASSRPLTELTLMANYTLDGLRARGYHLFNLSVHLLAGCVLFLLVRRLFRRPALATRYGAAADALALAVALLWTVHPLQTQAVTYIVQRAESMMGLFYLLTLYCAVRGFEAAEATGRNSAASAVRWYGAAVLCCIAGMAAKPVMATAPLMVLAIDYLLSARSLRDALRRRWGLYLALAATWLVLIVTTLGKANAVSAGFGYKAITPWEYACTQPRAILWYVRLAFWPDPLCFDYMRPALREWGRFLAPAAVVLLLLAVTLWLLVRRRPAALIGVWFFLILSVSSSIMPIADVCVEHRMYLSLAAVIALVVLAAYGFGGWALRRLAPPPQDRARWGRVAACVATGALVLLLGWRTAERNRDYRSEVALWRSVLRVRPDNPRAKLNYGYALFAEGRVDDAIAMTHDPALARDPAAHLNLGRFHAAQGRPAQAEGEYRSAIALDADFARAHYNLGNLLLQQERTAEAARSFAEAARVQPEWPAAHNNLGIALAKLSDVKAAEAQFRLALRLDPDYAAAHENLARLLTLTGREREALQEFAEAARARKR